MNRIKEVFGRSRVLLPVIHIKDIRQVRTCMKIAVNSGADGVFLIDHMGRWRSTLQVLAGSSSQFPELWIGVNLFGLTSADALTASYSAGPSGVWSDSAGVRGPHLSAAEIERLTGPWHRAQERNIVYFGGVAFKYQAPVTDLAGVARVATRVMDVVTTSGDRTGLPPTLDKIETMRDAIGGHAMAIASGITVENVRDYLPFCDAYLVATGISDGFFHLNAERTRALADEVHAYS